jgi:hypothetical protein
MSIFSSISEEVSNILSILVSTTMLLTVLSFLVKLYVDFLFKKKYETFIEELKWEAKIREQASSVGEYLSLVHTLKKDDSPELYRRVNQLAWGLAMWLPADLYRVLGKAVTKNNYSETMSVIITSH